MRWSTENPIFFKAQFLSFWAIKYWVGHRFSKLLECFVLIKYCVVLIDLQLCGGKFWLLPVTLA